ncbi:uncharacterized protein LOC135394378 [Ornithodoros turicata]|uniref:uncharacterized protein LOC135394378 n=1 Tax=Ornithodoros turicata TaxID=34597 RepID=UPI00313986E0
MSDSEFSNSDESLSLSGDENDFIDVDRLNYEDIDDPYEADPLPQQRGQQVEVVDDIQPIDFRCMCSHCSPQEVDEYVYCMAVDRVVPVVNGAGVRCITQHVLFPDFCTRRELLIVNGAPYRRHSRELRPLDPNDNRCIRYAAYACFTNWIWGYLGPRNRRQIPGCVVRTIRNLFPSATYTGYFP